MACWSAWDIANCGCLIANSCCPVNPIPGVLTLTSTLFGTFTFSYAPTAWTTPTFLYNYPGSGAPSHCIAVANVPLYFVMTCQFIGGVFAFQLELCNNLANSPTCPGNGGGASLVVCVNYTRTGGSSSCSPFQQVFTLPGTSAFVWGIGDMVTVTP